MAGDWLKIETCTPDKPEVIGIAAQLGIPLAHAFGCLFLVWRWFDQHTADGNAQYVTKVTLDLISGNAGFANAMERVGWLTVNEDGSLHLPHFERHCGETAKTRALTAKRVAKSKAKNAEKKVTPLPLPRDREEKSISTTTVVDKRAKQLPDDFTPNEWHNDFAAQNNLSLSEELQKFGDYHKSRGSTMKDWNAALRTWLRNAIEFRAASPPKANFTDRMQDVSNKLTGRKNHAATTIDVDKRLV